MDENIADFIKRVRLERASSMLKNFIDYNITRIGFEVGFSSTSSFSAAFKEYYGLTPSEYRKSESINLINKSTVIKNNERGFLDNKELQIVIFEDIDVIYARHIGAYHKALSAWDTVINFALDKDIMNDDAKFIGISYDDPSVTSVEKLRYDACISIEKEVSIYGDLGVNKIYGGLYGVYNFYGKLKELINAYEYIYKQWLPKSGYVPDDKNIIEICKKGISLDKAGKMHIDICLPIRKMQKIK